MNRAQNDNDLLAVTEEDALIAGALATLASVGLVAAIVAALVHFLAR